MKKKEVRTHAKVSTSQNFEEDEMEFEEFDESALDGLDSLDDN